MSINNKVKSSLDIKRSLPPQLQAICDIPGTIFSSDYNLPNLRCSSYAEFLANNATASENGWHSIDGTTATWSSKAPTVAGMLDDNTDVNDVDLAHSNQILSSIFKQKIPNSSCLDVAAGIGRVTKYCLSNYFDQIDLCEPNTNFLKASEEFLAGFNIGDRYPSPIQDFQFTKKYDCVWVQWCCGFATDESLVGFLNRCYAALKPDGVLIIRDNASSSDFSWAYDPEDGTLYRTKEMYEACVSCSKFKTSKSALWYLSQDYLPMIDLVLVK